MTVKQFRQALGKLPQDMPITFSSDEEGNEIKPAFCAGIFSDGIMLAPCEKVVVYDTAERG